MPALSLRSLRNTHSHIVHRSELKSPGATRGRSTQLCAYRAANMQGAIRPVTRRRSSLAHIALRIETALLLKIEAHPLQSLLAHRVDLTATRALYGVIEVVDLLVRLVLEGHHVVAVHLARAVHAGITVKVDDRVGRRRIL